MPPNVDVAKFRQMWLHLQADLTKLSTNSRQIFADQSSHFINFDQPELVIEGIRQVVNSARSLQRQSSNEHRPQLSSDTCGLACTKVLQMHKPV
jgi:hypothetical protein